MVIAALPAATSAVAGTTAATQAAAAAKAAQTAKAAQAAKAAQSARAVKFGTQAAHLPSQGVSLASLMNNGQPLIAQGTASQAMGGNLIMGGAGSNIGGMTPRAQQVAKASEFWPKFEAQYGGGDGMERGMRIAEGAMQADSNILGSMSNHTRDVIYPSRATNQWGPNFNPGLAGLMRQSEASFRGGFGGGRRR